MKQYELLCLFRYDNEPEGTLPAKMDVVHAAIEKHGGSIINEEDYGIRRLAYPIAQQSTGHYVLFNLNLEQQAVKPLSALLNIESALLRHQILTYVKTQKPREDEDAGRAPAPSDVSTAKPSETATSSAPLSSEELDKTIERILEEKVL
ncbi:30S ribosomal protein S6 [Candidatus Uhrbacteria bacterium]|nr:30S ribosomal protein S6 [Candidatus Uhrbacteria bacterium]